MSKARRLKLHEELVELLGSRNVYFQRPETTKMIYPCFVYSRSTGYNPRANNKSYLWVDCYSLTYIHKDPDDELPEKVRNHFNYISQGTPYKADNLYHEVFTLYY